MGGGTYTLTSQCTLKSNWTLDGSGSSGSGRTTIKPPTSWNRSGQSAQPQNTYYAIKVQNGNSIIENVTIQDIEFVDGGGKKADGAIRAFKARNLTLDNLVFKNFRLTGAYLERESGAEVKNCYFENTASNSIFDGSRTSQLWTRYLEDVTIKYNTFKTTYSNGYGYRGRGHEKAAIHNNTFDINNNFDIEIAHENEYGVQIYDNTLKQTISVPKSGQQSNPASRGYSYSINIYRNTSSSKEFVEGSRGWMEIAYNWVTSTTGNDRRFYTDFGSVSTSGDIKIHHNVVEGNRLSFIYVEGGGDGVGGRVNNLKVYTNTVYFSASHTATVIKLTKAGACNGWEIKNNVFVGSSGAQRSFISWDSASVVPSYTATNNVFQNVTNIPSNNHNSNPNLRLSGKKPYPYYSPANSGSNVVNRGTYVGFPYTGSNPDAGAFGWNLVPQGIWVKIIAKHSGKGMDVSGVSQNEGANIHLWDVSSGQHNKLWRFNYNGGGYYRIQVRHSSKYAKVSQGSTSNGASIQQASWVASDEFRWNPVAVENGTYYRIENKKSGKVIEVSGGSTSNGADIQQWTYGGGNNQRWRFESP